MGLSAFPCSFIIGFCAWTSRYVPSSLLLGRTRDLPVPVRDVSLRAQGLRPRGTPLHLALTMRRMLPSAWHHGVGVPESRMFRGSMPWPAISPVNASIPTLRLATHDSGPVWFATPSPYDSFIRFISPVFPGARRPTLRQHQAKGRGMDTDSSVRPPRAVRA